MEIKVYCLNCRALITSVYSDPNRFELGGCSFSCPKCNEKFYVSWGGGKASVTPIASSK